ncbi:MAG: hypothetical protein JW882_03155 [Deltaproteobacteria bacterium]|nr:hypothetical protein [Deltaproteobacteria bacterium]
MKKIKRIWIMAFGTFLLLLSFSGVSDACEITVDYMDKTKDVYKVNDEVILKIGVFLTHRNCPEGIDATTYKAENLEVIGATNWEEKSANYFERLIKVKIIDSESGESVFHVLRTCEKEGGYDSLKIVAD